MLWSTKEECICLATQTFTKLPKIETKGVTFFDDHQDFPRHLRLTFASVIALNMKYLLFSLVEEHSDHVWNFKKIAYFQWA